MVGDSNRESWMACGEWILWTGGGELLEVALENEAGMLLFSGLCGT